MKRSVEDEIIFPIPPPTKPIVPGLGATVAEQEAYDFETKVYREEIKEFVKRKAILRDNISKLYSLVWGQCTAPMRAKVKAMGTYKYTKKKTRT